MNKRQFRYFLISILILLPIFYLVSIFRDPVTRELFSRKYWRNLFDVGRAMRLVHHNYVDEHRVSYDILSDEALRGMMTSLDPYSKFLDNYEYEATFDESAYQPAHYGIGVQLDRVDSHVVIVSVFEGGAAYDARLRPGDMIVAVDGKQTVQDDGDLIKQVSELIRESLKPAVDVHIYRSKTDERFIVSLERRSFVIPTISNVEMTEDRIAYLLINSFSEKTKDEFAKTLNDLEADGMRALLMDLRNTPGRSLKACVDFAGQFVAKGKLIVFADGRHMDSRKEFRSETPARTPDLPIAILLNGESGETAVLVAGVLQDIDRVVVIGERSFGKGSAQGHSPLNEYEGLRYTNAYYYTPHHHTNINDRGVIPDKILEMSDEEESKLQKQRQHLTYMNPKQFAEEFGYKPIVDRQRDAALRMLKTYTKVDGKDGKL